MTKRVAMLVVFAGLLLPGAPAMGRTAADIPADAPNDGVMATPAEVEALARWAAAAFAGKAHRPAAARVTVELRRQDHNTLRFGRAILQTPLRIGGRTFKRGLGTHANSEIAVSIPPGAKAFRAAVGLDENPNTRAGRGSVRFVVEIAGKAVVRTPTLRCGDKCVDVRVDIPKGAGQLVLKVDATPDGTGWDHADWADARFVMGDGAVVWLDDQAAEPPPLAAGPPLSFGYGGKASGDLLKAWPRTVKSRSAAAFTRYDVAWDDPATKLRVAATVKVYRRYPAVDWVVHFENRGQRDTPILEDIQALDVHLAAGKEDIVLHGLAGDDCSERSFQPTARTLRPGQAARVAPVGGRSSNGAFPFFNLDLGRRGLMAAIGWSGQWAVSLQRAATGPARLRAGMERTHLRLHGGERIRTPRVLLMGWRGDRLAGHNRFRRLLLHHYVPQAADRPVAMPTFLQGYDRYRSHPKWRDEAGQLHAVNVAKALGCDFVWLDAAWFPGDFPNGVGNWTPKPKEFPRGLKPIGEACHRKGLRFIVWFEPERVAPGSLIAREHPEFVFGAEMGGLFKLNDAAARKWLTELLSRRIGEFAMDWYRNDFNIDPLPFWRANDPPDRQGITEIRYVEGHYALWDALRAAHPGLQIDNCASGGRRIDLETCMRSFPLWRSDTACRPGQADWDQAQILGMSLYLPLHQTCGWSPEPYVFRSAAGAGAITQFAFLDEGFDLAAAQAAVAEAKENRKYWYGDFYPLTACSADPTALVAWQLHRPDLNAGLVLAFRRRDCDVFGLSVKLGGLDAEASYALEFIDEQRRRTVRKMTGREMAADLPLLIPKRRASLLVRYAAADGPTSGPP